MAIAPRLDLRQSQTLVMTPQLRQAIKLLQFSNIEVNAFVEEEIDAFAGGEFSGFVFALAAFGATTRFGFGTKAAKVFHTVFVFRGGG